MSNFDAFLSQLKNLSTEELKLLSQKIMMQLQGSESCKSSSQSSSSVTSCKKCGDKDCISKYGKDKNGKQRYRCKHCGAVFTETSYTVFSHTHCDFSKWEKYIQLLLQGVSIQKSANLCKISTRTAFLWRHKILSTLQLDQENRVLSGIIEADETFFSVSYKGNHKKSKHFVMPRKPYRRGTDSRSQIGSRTCVMCALERNGQVYAEVLGKGQPTIAMLSHAFDSRIIGDSVVISDKAVGIRHYFENIPGIQHIHLLAVANTKKKFGPPEIRGAFHIQNVNNMHTRIRTFMRKYNGVSTKYLNHYINLFVWMDNYKKLEQVDYESQLLQHIKLNNTYRSGKFLSHLPQVPCVA